MSGRGRHLDIDSAGAQHGDELAGRQARSFRQQYALAAHGGMLANDAPPPRPEGGMRSCRASGAATGARGVRRRQPGRAWSEFLRESRSRVTAQDWSKWKRSRNQVWVAFRRTDTL